MALADPALQLATGGTSSAALSAMMTALGVGLLIGGVGVLLLALRAGRPRPSRRTAERPALPGVLMDRSRAIWSELNHDTGRPGEPLRPWPADALLLDTEPNTVEGPGAERPARPGAASPPDGSRDRSRS